MVANTNINDALDLIDQLIFNYTGKQLDSVQKSILIGALKNENYNKIAQETDYSDSYLKNRSNILRL